MGPSIIEKVFGCVFFLRSGYCRLDLKLKWWLEQEERIVVMFCHFLHQPTVHS